MTPDDLRAARKRLGMTQAQLAAALLLPSGEKTINRYERGKHGIPGPVALLIKLWLYDRNLMKVR